MWHRGYFTSLCGCVNAFKNDNGQVFTAEEVSKMATDTASQSFLSPSYASEEEREERERSAEERCMIVLGLGNGGDLVPTQLGAATGPCCSSMLTSTFWKVADENGVATFEKSDVSMKLHLSRDSPEVQYQIYERGTGKLLDAGSGLVDADTVYLVNVAGTASQMRLWQRKMTGVLLAVAIVVVLVGNELWNSRNKFHGQQHMEKREEAFPASYVPGAPSFRSKDLPTWMLGTFSKPGSTFSHFVAQAGHFLSGAPSYDIPAGDPQCAIVTRLVNEFKETGQKTSAAGFLEKRTEELQFSNGTYAEVRRHEVTSSDSLPRMLRDMILRIHYFFFKGGYTKFFGIATSDPGCKSGGRRSPGAFGSLVRCSRLLRPDAADGLLNDRDLTQALLRADNVLIPCTLEYQEEMVQAKRIVAQIQRRSAQVCVIAVLLMPKPVLLNRETNEVLVRRHSELLSTGVDDVLYFELLRDVAALKRAINLSRAMWKTNMLRAKLMLNVEVDFDSAEEAAQVQVEHSSLLWEQIPKTLMPEFRPVNEQILETTNMVGHFRLITRLPSRKGMVLQAVDADQKAVAIKIFEKSQTQDPGLLESIYREFRLTGEVVRHPNIAKCLDMIHSLSRVYLVMEFAGGATARGDGFAI
ncbi:CIPK7 [Symbiodinium sp. CCMP2592]|nr:CIPK7 [Symbiodinium sp. CCMP2592]